MIGSTIVSSPEDGLDKLAKHARGVLVALAALQTVSVAILYAAGGVPTTLDLGLGLALGGVFAGLAVWARRNPTPAVLTGFAIWLALSLLVIVLDPSTLSGGWVMRILIIAAFFNGISTGRTHDEMKREVERSRPAR